MLRTASDKKLNVQHILYFNPIYDLLRVQPFIRTEIPLDFIGILISVGCDVNVASGFSKSCLDAALENHHYNIVRLLVKHGARCNSDVHPILLSLAAQPCVPLDLFDLLATPQNLNYCCQYEYLPLHKAVSSCQTETALHLIKLGASVNQNDGWSKLPIEYFVEEKGLLTPFDNELFTSMLPSKDYGVNILKSICTLVSMEKRPNTTESHLFEMLHQLLQRLHFDEVLEIKIHRGEYEHMSINGIRISPYIPHIPGYSRPLCTIYLCSLILVELQFDFTSVPVEVADDVKSQVTNKELTNAHTLEDVWTNCHQQCPVKSLLRLCILCTRNTMSSLDDESFLSLPVPPYIRELLTYRDVSEKIFEKWSQSLTM